MMKCFSWNGLFFKTKNWTSFYVVRKIFLGGIFNFSWGEILKSTQKAPESRGSGNDFGRFSISFFEGRISYIRAACNYPIRNANFKSWISDIQLLSKIVEYLPENINWCWWSTSTDCTFPGSWLSTLSTSCDTSKQDLVWTLQRTYWKYKNIIIGTHKLKYHTLWRNR